MLSVAVAETALYPCHCYEIVKVREATDIAAMQRPWLVRVLAKLQTILVVGA
jgi:hypothetical protein